MTDTVPGLAELPEMATLGLKTAPRHCTPACHDYHAIWGFLRLFGRLPAVAADHDLLTSALGDAACEGGPRVLVSGSADHGLLAYVLAAFESAGRRPDVTVIDRCATPLELCTRYATDRGLEITTHATEALAFAAPSFDLIVAHNFLNAFDADGRDALVRHWAGMLAPEGRIVSVTTVKLGAPPRSKRFEGAEAEGLIHRVAQDRAASPHAGLIDEPSLRALTAGYCRLKSSWNVTTIEALEAHFTAAGLAVETTVGPNPQRMTTTTQKVKQRTRIVARHTK